MEVSVILATYNESGNILKLLSAIRQQVPHCELVLVDDNSPDRTGRIVKDHFAHDSKVKVIIRPERGLASAIRRGIDEASGDILVLMDADFSHDPKEIPKLVSIAKENGMSNGSRFLQQGEFVSKAYRSFGTRFIQYFARFMLGVPISDFSNGFIALRREALSGLHASKIFFGYGDYAFRLFYYAHKKGVKIVETPSIYKPRIHGQSKTSEIKIGIEYMIKILALKFLHKTP